MAAIEVSRYLPMLRAQVLRALDEEGESIAPESLETALSLAQISIRLNPDPAVDPATPLVSKISGTPDLPSGFMWPLYLEGRPLVFQAQVNLGQLPRCDSEGLLPTTGMLAFFIEEYNGHDAYSLRSNGTRDAWKVCYFEDATGLVPTPPSVPAGYEAVALTPTCELVLPAAGSRAMLSALPQEDLQTWWYHVDTHDFGDPPVHRMLGNEQQVQNDMTLDCSLIARGQNPYQDRDTPEVEAALAAIREDAWTLLLQVDSSPQWTIGDCGMNYFWIRRQDLLDRNFDATLMCHQSH